MLHTCQSPQTHASTRPSSREGTHNRALVVIVVAQRIPSSRPACFCMVCMDVHPRKPMHIHVCACMCMDVHGCTRIHMDCIHGNGCVRMQAHPPCCAAPRRCLGAGGREPRPGSQQPQCPVAPQQPRTDGITRHATPMHASESGDQNPGPCAASLTRAGVHLEQAWGVTRMLMASR